MSSLVFFSSQSAQNSIFCKKKVPSLLSLFLAPKTVFSAKRSCFPWSFFSPSFHKRTKTTKKAWQLFVAALVWATFALQTKTASQSGPGKRVPCALLYLAWNAAVFVIFVICTTLAATFVILFTLLGKIFHYKLNGMKEGI